MCYDECCCDDQFVIIDCIDKIHTFFFHKQGLTKTNKKNKKKKKKNKQQFHHFIFHNDNEITLINTINLQHKLIEFDEEQEVNDDEKKNDKQSQNENKKDKTKYMAQFGLL